MIKLIPFKKTFLVTALFSSTAINLEVRCSR